MKHFLITMAVLMMPFAMSAQDEYNKQEASLEPEFNNHSCILNSDSTTTLLPLENVTIKGKSTHWGLIPVPGAGLLDKNKTYLVMAGEKSKLTVKPGTVNIILKVKDNNDDPRTSLGFMKLEVKKKKRQTEWMSFDMLKGTKLDFFGENDYKVRKFGKSSYLITLENLKPGQYALGTKDGTAMATFGVE